MALLRNRQQRETCAAAIAAAALLVCAPLGARAAETPIEDLDIFELSELSSQVYSAAKRSQPLRKTAAAAHVITREDILRSGHSSIPELLRTVPGVNVHRIDSNFWAISIRGNIETFNRSLLVLVDGRSVYSPLFGGTYWDLQHMPLEDIERIEVIRGPGGAVWGANATNGVINIIRRTPAEQASYVSTSVGTQDRLLTSFGHATSLGERLRVLVSGNYANVHPTYDRTTGEEVYDDLRLGASHFRADLDVNDQNFLRVQGDWYGADRGNVFRLDTPASLLTGCDAASAEPLCAGIPGYQVIDTGDRLSGGNMMLGWEHRASETSFARLDLYWDHQQRDSSILEEVRNTFDLEFRHSFKPLAQHTLQWGGGARLMLDRTDGSFNYLITEGNEEEMIYSGFAEDELALLGGKLNVTLGTKVEYHGYTGWEVQPSGRFAYDAGDRHQVWGAFSRAVRTPSRAERSGFAQLVVVFPGLPAQPAILRGTDDFDSEVLLVSELGYRYQPTDWLHTDLAVFANDYENYRNLVPTAGGSNPFDVTFDNGGTVKSYGAELSLAMQPLPYWKVRGSWTHIHRGGNERAAVVAPHQLALLSYMELPGHLELDAGIYYTGRIQVSEQPPEVMIPGFWRLDLRLGWSPRPSLEFALVGQNLTEHRHAEYAHLNVRTAAPLADLGTRYNELPRAGYAQVTWRY